MSVSRRQWLLGSLALPAYAAKPKPPRPNLLLVLTDSVPAWMLGCYGNKEVRTPNLDRLAQTGTRMSRHFACSPVASAGRATLLTGRTPMQLGDTEETPASGTLATALEAIGYTTPSGDLASAVRYVETTAAVKPFFFTANVRFEPPYEGVAQKYLDLYAGAKFDSLNLERAPSPNARGGKEMLADPVAAMRKAAAALTALDDQTGDLVAAVSRKGLLDSTMIVVTSGAGALLGRHGLWGAGDASAPPNFFDEALATPMILSWRGHVPAQAVRPEMTSACDFVPTICGLVGADLPAPNPCGRSWWPLVTGGKLPKKQPWHATVFAHYRNGDMARTERYKLVVRDGGKGPGELYDVVADPGEKTNQYANQQFLTVKTSLSQSLTGWLEHYSK